MCELFCHAQVVSCAKPQTSARPRFRVQFFLDRAQHAEAGRGAKRVVYHTSKYKQTDLKKRKGKKNKLEPNLLHLTLQ